MGVVYGPALTITATLDRTATRHDLGLVFVQQILEGGRDEKASA